MMIVSPGRTADQLIRAKLGQAELQASPLAEPAAALSTYQLAARAAPGAIPPALINATSSSLRDGLKRTES